MKKALELNGKINYKDRVLRLQQAVTNQKTLVRFLPTAKKFPVSRCSHHVEFVGGKHDQTKYYIILYHFTLIWYRISSTR